MARSPSDQRQHHPHLTPRFRLSRLWQDTSVSPGPATAVLAPTRWHVRATEVLRSLSGPKGEPALKARVVTAVTFLVAAKVPTRLSEPEAGA